MPGHRHRRQGPPDGGVVHMGQALGAKINIQHHRALAESSGERSVVHQAIPQVGETALAASDVELEQDATEVQTRQHVGFATEPGYDLTQYRG